MKFSVLRPRIGVSASIATLSVASFTGSSDYDIYKDGFHDRLSRYWPEPREQLHAGGWRRTRQMVTDIKGLMPTSADGVPNVLDLCCGEGATASYLAATEGWRMTGLDIVESACKVARSKANDYGTIVRVKIATSTGDSRVHLKLSYDTVVRIKLSAVDGGSATAAAAGLASAVCLQLSYETLVHVRLDARVKLCLSYQDVRDLVTIVHASIYDMPLPSNSYDVVYGQDPDGLANEHRVHAFREVLRVLRPGGLFYFWHHWIPGPGWPVELLHRYWTDPVTGSPRLSYECYLEDLQASGLRVASISDCTPLAEHHMSRMASRMRKEAPAECGPGGLLPDKWLERTLQFAKEGGTMGIHVVAFKPAEAA